jgi:tetratricopeptide (TPR) repeat protein
LQVGVLNEKLRGTEFALLAWEKGLERFPNDLGLNQRLGLSLVKLRRMNQARPYLERTLELDPDNAAVRRALDEVHAQAKGA